MKGRRALGDTWQHALKPCLTRTCQFNTGLCQIVDVEEECTVTKCNKGEYLNTFKPKAGKCCATHECLPCNCCDEKTLDCPKIEEVKCNKCEVEKTVSLIEGTECCCPAEKTCVEKLCPAIKVASCRSCEMIVEASDECGCKSTICKPRPAPICSTCAKLICAGTDKADGCPIYECEAYELTCPEGHHAVTEQEGVECPSMSCCPTATVPTTAPTTASTTAPTSTTVQTTTTSTTTTSTPCTCACEISHVDFPKSQVLAAGKVLESPCTTIKCELSEACTCTPTITSVPKPVIQTCKKGLYSAFKNLVIFEVFWVKFSAEKSIFQNCLSGSFYGAISKNRFSAENFTQKTSKMTKFLNALHLHETPAVKGKCHATTECLPCLACSSEDQALKCPAVEKPVCGECECQQVANVVAGEECCCPCDFECVPRTCDAPKAPLCKKCQAVVESTDNCGCQILTCGAVLECPACDSPCCTAVIGGDVDEEGCPVCLCSCEGTKCADHLITEIVDNSNPKCPVISCCEAQTTTVGTTSTSGTSTTGTTVRSKIWSGSEIWLFREIFRIIFGQKIEIFKIAQ